MAEPGSTHYLVGLDLRDRRVVVVGAGMVAQRRVPRLTAGGAHVEVIAPQATSALRAMSEDGSIVLRSRTFAPGDLAGAWYVIACTDDPDVNAAVVREATAAQVFCVRADRAAGGTAVTPAGAEHDGLTLGVLAGGDYRRSARTRSAILQALRTGLITTTPAVAPRPRPGPAPDTGGCHY